MQNWKFSKYVKDPIEKFQSVLTLETKISWLSSLIVFLFVTALICFAQIRSLYAGEDFSHYPPDQVQAAQGMESMLMEHLISEMRKSIPDDELIPKSQTEKVFQGMLDSEYAETMARSNSLGISRQILEHWQSQH